MRKDLMLLVCTVRTNVAVRLPSTVFSSRKSRRQNILTVFWNVSSVNSMLRLHAVAVLPVRNS